jgi:hypothetical protein
MSALVGSRDDQRAWRLGTALSGMANDLASARREIAMLRRENQALRASLDHAGLGRDGTERSRLSA